VLLFSAVLVNLAGVMFESGRFDSGLYEQQKQFLTWVVVVIIVVSITYFTVVLVSEVYIMCDGANSKVVKQAKAKASAWSGKKPTGGVAAAAGAGATSTGKKDPARAQALSDRRLRVVTASMNNAASDVDEDGVSNVVNPMFRSQMERQQKDMEEDQEAPDAPLADLIAMLSVPTASCWRA
jgi:hypothetical protein